jgi:ubiquinone/menaquinone biosynthesis C-methylase UbiE
MLKLALEERLARPGRARTPEPMIMDDPDGARAFHYSASQVQLPVYEFNASMMSRLLPAGGTVLDLGSGSGQLAAHLASGRPDVTIRCIDLSEEMLALGRAMAAERGLDRLSFVSADITLPADDVVGAPNLVCCNWTLHQLPNRDVAVAALAEIARIRDLHGCAVWIFDFARLRRGATMPAFFDIFTPAGHDRLRVDALASEAAAWTVDEMRAMLTDAGLSGLQCSRTRPLGIYQAWWSVGTRATRPPTWKRPPMSDRAAYLADRTIAAMSNLPG